MPGSFTKELKFGAFITGFLLISVMLKSLLLTLLMLLFAPVFGMRCSMVSLFGLTFVFDRDGSHTCRFAKLTPICTYSVAADLKDSDSYDAKKSDQKQFLCDLLARVLLLLIGIGIALCCMDNIRHCIEGNAYVWEFFLAGFGTGMVFHSLMSLVSMGYTWGVMMKRLGGFTQKMIHRLRAGEPIEQLPLGSVKELGYAHASKTEKMLYYPLYLAWLFLHDRIGDMQPPIREMTEYLLDKDLSMNLTGCYYWLIFYYSRYEINPMLAREFFKKTEKILLSDNDPNAKRVLGYYYFGIERDPAAAARYVADGFACLDRFPASEREMERRLLHELDGSIRSEQTSTPG